MGILGLRLDLGGVDKGLEQLLGEDLPFTIARFLTMMAQEGQGVSREAEKRVFKLRNDWTVRNTRITPATKTKLFSEVFTDTSNQKTGADDYLPRQEDGGEKVPVAGHSFLAIPTKYLRKYVPDNKPIPDNMRPRAILPAGADLGQSYGGKFSSGSRSNGTKRLIGRQTMKKLGSGEFEAFIQTTKSGTLCIFVRHGGMGYKGARDAEPWYTLVREAHVKPVFPMEQLVEQVVGEKMEATFNRAAAEVLVNDALKNGLQVRF